ncbi:acetoacetate--CoA ligase [Ectothiorhodospira sp. BSL-9]|uniref:acetoacetate--CoA ligase n=1 Tax=Ectothiorhodospira sp. BSL-9 TaxID=1442136 RepID=UPI0007B453DF|nr:acetoacetate--CoA ligase [Ectothiorhodospira sp. BSL-9]ANB03482.1 acetoacetyl-CoA synthetase [Ectothiorhodospira sp. BSL-9]
MSTQAEILWQPGPRELTQSAMARYRDWLVQQGHGPFQDYHALHRWSVSHPEAFWDSIWRHTGVRASREPEKMLESATMPGARWFVGARLNFAENLLRHAIDGNPNEEVVLEVSESREDVRLDRATLLARVASLQAWLREQGVNQGDRVAGVVGNTHEALVGMLATTSLGAIWSSASPDFGVSAIVDRFGQIEPRVLLLANGYRYNGKVFDRTDQNLELARQIPGLQRVLSLPMLPEIGHPDDPRFVAWDTALEAHPQAAPVFEQLPPDHPVYILYSSGTTGVPKCIVHGAGGMLLNHSKELLLHADLRPGDTFFYFTTTGWMMWNWLASGLLTGARLVLFDGSPAHPDLDCLWSLISREKVTHFGTSAKYLGNCRKTGLEPGNTHDLSALRALFSTGSPLLPEDFDWVYHSVKADLMLSSISGGTDICGCFVGGTPLLPVRRGEIQCRMLGVDARAYTPDGRDAGHDRGELVCVTPFPAMPVRFWNDPDGARYRKSYFATYPGIWAHGDFVQFTPHGGAIIYGRSDATLNPGGVRIGTAEIYRQVETIAEVADSLVVGAPHEDGDVEVVLFVVMAPEQTLTPELEKRIRSRIRANASPRHMPARIHAVSQIPYTRSGKKVELAVARMLQGETDAENLGALANPESLQEIARCLTQCATRPAVQGGEG